MADPVTFGIVGASLINAAGAAAVGGLAMGALTPKVPSPPPLPAPPPTPTPPALDDSAAVEEARQEEKRRVAARQGRQSTIVAGNPLLTTDTDEQSTGFLGG